MARVRDGFCRGERKVRVRPYLLALTYGLLLTTQRAGIGELGSYGVTPCCGL
jgi:hypothetical protein